MKGVIPLIAFVALGLLVIFAYQTVREDNNAGALKSEENEYTLPGGFGYKNKKDYATQKAVESIDDSNSSSSKPESSGPQSQTDDKPLPMIDNSNSSTDLVTQNAPLANTDVNPVAAETSLEAPRCNEMRTLFSLLSIVDQQRILNVSKIGKELVKKINIAREEVVRSFSCGARDKDVPGTYWKIKERREDHEKGAYYANYGYKSNAGTTKRCTLEPDLRPKGVFSVSFWRSNRHSTPVSEGWPEMNEKSTHANSGAFDDSGVYFVECSLMTPEHIDLYHYLNRYFEATYQETSSSYTLVQNIGGTQRWERVASELDMNTCKTRTEPCPEKKEKVKN